jgi:hypothetical protein
VASDSPPSSAASAGPVGAGWVKNPGAFERSRLASSDDVEALAAYVRGIRAGSRQAAPDGARP